MTFRPRAATTGTFSSGERKALQDAVYHPRLALPNNALVHQSKRRLETAPPSRIDRRAGSAGRLSACDLRRSVAAASVRRLAIFTETGHNESDGCGIVEPQLSERLIAAEGRLASCCVWHQVARRANSNVAPSPHMTAPDACRVLAMSDGRFASPALAFAAQ